MSVLLDVAPVAPIGPAELLLLFGCCGLGLLLVGGGVAVAFLVKKKR